MIKVAPTGQKDSVEMRKVYAGFVAKQIEAGSEIIALEADLMSSMAMDGVARDYPQHVINCGIMEANVIGTAAGLSLTGRKPFVHTFTAFASRRCFDQLFMSLDYQRNNVKVIASDAGVTACHNGGTHMSFEDMGIVRGLAHSVVLEVTDAVMFEDVLRQLIDLEGFYWVRTIRKQAPSVYAPGSTFTIGKGNVLREGTDITLIANGIMVAEALEAARLHCTGKLWCVFGCGGDRDKGKRPLMGAIAEQFADIPVVTDDNPRTEEPRAIINDILAGMLDAGRARVVEGRAEAVTNTIMQAQENDVVLLAGKGHEDYQIVGNRRLDYSDRVTAARLLGVVA